MKTVNVCPACRHENETTAGYCAGCGRLLVALDAGIATVKVPDAENIVRAKNGVHPPQDIRSESIALIVPGAVPIIINNKDRLILGRSAPDDSPVTVDLSGHGARESGVSRRHAMISRTDDGYTIKDLNSSNGTRLNGTRLEPQIPYKLQSGDQIQLGIMTLYAYFNVKVSP